MRPPFRPLAASRRRFLTMAGLGAAAALGGGTLLSGCGRDPEAGGAATQLDRLADQLPTHQPLDLVTPDLVVPPPAASAFTRYPSELTRAITEQPGRGGPPIQATTLYWGPTPPGSGRNAYLDTINDERLGVTCQFSIQDGNTYDEPLTAMLAARDVPDVLVVPSWNTNVPRFSDAASLLFADLSEYLSGDQVLDFPMLATLPTDQWQHCFWGERLRAVPFVNDNPFGWVLFHRADLFGPMGLGLPTTAEELYEIGREVTDPGNNVWAFNDIWRYVKMVFGVPNDEEGYSINSAGEVVHEVETEEYAAALEFARRLFDEGLIHPDSVADPSTDPKPSFASGQVMFMQDGLGAWRGMQLEEQRATSGFDMQAVPVFAHDGGAPVVYGGGEPIFYTFIKEGLGEDRVREILGVLNWCAAPFGTEEWEERQHGFEGVHFDERAEDGTPVNNDTFHDEYAEQFTFLSGRNPVQIGSPEIPGWVESYAEWASQAAPHIPENPWAAFKLEQPAAMSQARQFLEDTEHDLLRGRRDLSDLDDVIAQWRRTGGDRGRDFLAGALEDDDN
ncbi:extracellular solute-binding protein [Natronosporangium hydrolyticum]|uniref:Extracellular solute-binding protein n=1 Tax=Natronosporangium hydrolyticum TaxID=2811111 RepID=A0A895YQK1_9ACTN|nr:extracellular solute-binding protein [Natronosporangium hydrolyticum]QSB16400.1 extracellular solute-binding protein [Natronosporangium hydrolyticum]